MRRHIRWATGGLLALAALLLLAPAAPALSGPSPALPADPPAVSPARSAVSSAAAPVLAATMSATQMTKLTASDGANGDALGYAVAVSGNVIAVSATARSVGTQVYAGTVYIYTRSGGSWTRTQEIVPDASAGSARLGFSVALQGDTLVIGAPGATVNAVLGGAVYVYKDLSGVWALSQTLLPAERSASWGLGSSVALDGDQLLIGASGAYDAMTTSGAGYVYTRASGVWSESAELLPAAGNAEYDMGFSAAISGDTALLGAWDARDRGGRVWVFTKSGSTWTNTQVLDGPADSQLGVSMALSGDMASIGANAQTVNGNEWQGAVHVFTRSGGVWTEVQQITLADGAKWDEFGFDVALSGKAMVATVLRRVDVSPTGEAWKGEGFVYILRNGVWERQATTLSANDLLTSSMFGYDAALDGGVAVVGAPALYDLPLGPGAAYAFEITDTVTPSVSGGHGSVSPATAQQVPLGDAPTFTFAPEAGYAVDQVLLDGAAVEMTGDNVYTFAPVYADHTLAVGFYNTAGPTTTIKGAPRGWSRGPVGLRFAAIPAVDGKPVAFIECKVDGKDWKQGTAVTVRRQGQTRVQARATDTRGNVGPTVAAVIGVDHTTPVVTGYGRPLGRVSGATAFRFKVKDAAAKAVDVVLAVTRYHQPVQQYDLGTVATGKVIARRVALGLPVGTWSWRIVARDPAGNRGLCRWRFLDVTP